MNVRRRNKRSNRWDQGGELPFKDFSFNKSQEIIALERDRLKQISQEMKREEYVNRLRRFGFKVGK